jgi:hypothetical protein
VDNLNANWERIIAAQRRVILAARVVDLETRQYQQGLRTSTDVLDAQARWLTLIPRRSRLLRNMRSPRWTWPSQPAPPLGPLPLPGRSLSLKLCFSLCL